LFIASIDSKSSNFWVLNDKEVGITVTVCVEFIMFTVVLSNQHFGMLSWRSSFVTAGYRKGLDWGYGYWVRFYTLDPSFALKLCFAMAELNHKFSLNLVPSTRWPYKVLHNTAPRYLGPLIRAADIPGRRALRSAITDRLAVPCVRLHTVRNRAFPVAARRSGTVCRTTSYFLHPSLPSVAYWKLLFSVSVGVLNSVIGTFVVFGAWNKWCREIFVYFLYPFLGRLCTVPTVSFSDLILNCFSLVCNLWHSSGPRSSHSYLGHYKNYY